MIGAGILTAGIPVMAEENPFDTAPEAVLEEASEEVTEEVTESAPSGRIEGEGYDTPEEAAAAYISGLIHEDINEMISACAVESFVENYDLSKQIERLQVLQAFESTYAYLPSQGKLSDEINLEIRRANLMQMIKFQYLSLVRRKTDGMTVPLKEYDSADALIDDMIDSGDLDISFDGTFLPPVVVTDRYCSFNVQKNLYRNAVADNAERIDSVAALIKVNGSTWLLTLGAEKYDGRWYITLGNTLSAILGLEAYAGGICPFSEADYLANSEIYRLYSARQTVQAGNSSKAKIHGLLDKLTEVYRTLDLSPVFSLPNDQSEEAFEKAVMEALGKELTPEEMKYFEDFFG